MEITTILGIPAHPLMVHAPVVLGLWLRRRAATSGVALGPNPGAVLAVAIATAFIGVIASYQIYRIGHSGANATWSDVEIRPEREGGDRE